MSAPVEIVSVHSNYWCVNVGLFPGKGEVWNSEIKQKKVAVTIAKPSPPPYIFKETCSFPLFLCFFMQLNDRKYNILLVVVYFAEPFNITVYGKGYGKYQNTDIICSFNFNESYSEGTCFWSRLHWKEVCRSKWAPNPAFTFCFYKKRERRI